MHINEHKRSDTHDSMRARETKGYWQDVLSRCLLKRTEGKVEYFVSFFSHENIEKREIMRRKWRDY